MKLMGPGASFTMASSSSFFTLMRPGGGERWGPGEHSEGQRGHCLQAAGENTAHDHRASRRVSHPLTPDWAVGPAPLLGDQGQGEHSASQHRAAPASWPRHHLSLPELESKLVVCHPHVTDEETEAQRN